MKTAILILALLVSAAACSRVPLNFEGRTRTFYVATNGNDMNPGTKDKPLLSIQIALNRTRVTPDVEEPTNTVIRVAEGTYLPGKGLNPRNVGVSITRHHGALLNDSKITLSGGWNAGFTARTGQSVLDGGGSLYHILYIENRVKVENLVLKNGNAMGDPVFTNAQLYYLPGVQAGNTAMIPFVNGGGLFLAADGCVLSNISFSGNSAVSSGGSVYLMGSGSILAVSGTLDSNAVVIRGANSVTYVFGIETNTNAGSTNTLPADLTALYVSTAGSDSNPGTAALPLRSFDLAVSNAAANGYTNLFAGAGTYSRGSGLAAGSKPGFNLTRRIPRITGGWDASWTAAGGMTTLDLTGGAGAKMAGVTNVRIENLVFAGGTNDNGGGLFVDNSSLLLVSNCRFVSNRATIFGGGLYFNSVSFSTVIDSVFVSNTSVYDGGGIYLLNAVSNRIDASFISNSARKGGAIALSGFTNAVSGAFTANSATSDGGAVWFDGYGSAAVTGTFISNRAAYGGGFYLAWNHTAPTKVFDAVFTGNSASVSGGTVYAGPGTGSLLLSNSALTGSWSEGPTNSVVFVSADYGMLQVSLLNNTIGGTNGGAGCGFFENAADLSGHTLRNNRFLTNTLASLYYDNDNAQTIGTGAAWTNVNRPAFTGAETGSTNNTVF